VNYPKGLRALHVRTTLAALTALAAQPDGGVPRAVHPDLAVGTVGRPHRAGTPSRAAGTDGSDASGGVPVVPYDQISTEASNAC
jgi:hypothetical protein